VIGKEENVVGPWERDDSEAYTIPSKQGEAMMEMDAVRIVQAQIIGDDN
jgi:hypothetical protein